MGSVALMACRRQSPRLTCSKTSTSTNTRATGIDTSRALRYKGLIQCLCGSQARGLGLGLWRRNMAGMKDRVTVRARGRSTRGSIEKPAEAPQMRHGSFQPDGWQILEHPEVIANLPSQACQTCEGLPQIHCFHQDVFLSENITTFGFAFRPSRMLASSYDAPVERDVPSSRCRTLNHSTSCSSCCVQSFHHRKRRAGGLVC